MIKNFKRDKPFECDIESQMEWKNEWEKNRWKKEKKYNILNTKSVIHTNVLPRGNSAFSSAKI